MNECMRTRRDFNLQVWLSWRLCNWGGDADEEEEEGERDDNGDGND